MAKLEGKIALITGASSGLGEATARALAAAGAHVVVCARRADRLDALVSALREQGLKSSAIVADITQESAARDVVDRVVKNFERIDILVNSAGGMQMGGVENANMEHWRGLMELNFYATLYMCTAAVDYMKRQGSGHIVNISSTAGRLARFPVSPYAASKYAVTGMTEAMRQELAPMGIRVCLIEPGSAATEISDKMATPGQRAMMTERLHHAEAMQASDVADAIAFVVSLHPRANVSDLLIVPTIDATPM